MAVRTALFENFGANTSAREVGRDQKSSLLLTYSRNPYGGHNLILVLMDDNGWRAIRHGDLSVCLFLLQWGRKALYRKARKFLALRGRGVNWVGSYTPR